MQGFQILLVSGASHQLLQAFVLGTFRVPAPYPTRPPLLQCDSALATLQFPPATFFLLENLVSVHLHSRFLTLDDFFQ